MITGFEFNQRPLTIPLKMSHRLQSPSTFLVERKLVTKPTKEWTNLICVVVFHVSLKILLTLGYPNPQSERLVLTIDRNQQDSSNEKVLIIYGTNVGIRINAGTPLSFGYTEVRIRPLKSDVG